MRTVLPAMLVTVLCSCEKSTKLLTTEELVDSKIENVIPARYLDTLRKLGLHANRGINPPNIEGNYFIRPHLLDAGNVPGDEHGRRFADAQAIFSTQSNKDFAVNFTGSNFVSRYDTSLATVIAGQGNDFTVYGKVKAVNGEHYAIFGVVISGTRLGSDLRDLRIGIINIDDSHGGGQFIKEGQGRVGYDADDVTHKE
ncbi:hypothetical protein MKQ68_03720 [Chitinophaga horti]|uniref:DUF4251 domain-containing protein n=1 Tax=Chitinophaga horti TaxID=2920382 RepID=A0ABY6J7C9_9BACT|nr:hypothetical protein [Chitinophaga horti]UYQ94199.1 hypothetical protein MKQ68_03720 [Chitinophaga horti]